jgi:hypothetical protein
VSLHGDQDGIVPFGTALISVVVYPIFVVDGSSSIHARAAQVGLDNCFYPMWGADHTPHVSGSSTAAYTDTTLVVVTNFLQRLICGGPNNCGYLVSNDQPLPDRDLTVYPNPAASQLRIRVPEAQSWTWTLLDFTGRTVAEGQVQNAQETELQRRFAAGVYLLRVQAEEGEWTRKVVFE